MNFKSSTMALPFGRRSTRTVKVMRIAFFPPKYLKCLPKSFFHQKSQKTRTGAAGKLKILFPEFFTYLSLSLKISAYNTSVCAVEKKQLDLL